MDNIKAIDWLDIFTFLGFTLMLLLGLDLGGAFLPWGSVEVIALLAVGSIMFFAFIYTDLRLSRYSLIPLELFQSKSNVAAFAVIFLHEFVYFQLSITS